MVSTSLIISAVANFNIQHNFQVIAIALQFMDDSTNDADSGGPLYPRTKSYVPPKE